MIRPALIAALVLAGMTCPATAQTPPPPPPADARAQADAYVMAAGRSDLYEVNSSQIALQKSQNPAIRRYAEMLVKHHQKTNAATIAAARKAGLTPPPPVPDPGAAASIAELQSATPADLDRLYLGQQVPAHQAALDLHEGYGSNGDKPALRGSARKAVPIVQQHLTLAQTLVRQATAVPGGM